MGAGFFFAFLIAYCLSSVVRVANQTGDLRASYVFLPILIPFVVDAGAMIVGKYLGKRKLTPHLSPKKTVEGAIGGLVVGVVIAIVYGIVFHFITKVEVNYYFLAVYGLLGGVITQVGDLFFSYLKRNRKIKDFGHIFLEHGGVLDRFDSVIFAAPVIELLILWAARLSVREGRTMRSPFHPGLHRLHRPADPGGGRNLRPPGGGPHRQPEHRPAGGPGPENFIPILVAAADPIAAAALACRLADTDIQVLAGEEGILAAASLPQADTAVTALVGIAGLAPTPGGHPGPQAHCPGQ